MDYRGNQLSQIQELASNHYYSGINSLKEYVQKHDGMFEYDANGNLISDNDREILKIEYNLLNLPSEILFKNDNKIFNIYTADGRKLSSYYATEIATSGSSASGVSSIRSAEGTHYIDNIEYLFKIENSEERPNFVRISNTEGYYKNGYFYYFRKDHLGNNREVWRANDNQTVQVTNYYPSGLPWQYETPVVQPYMYNGKEFIEMNGYDTYDYGFRGYYAATGRFTTVDRMAEKYYNISPYAYCAGNPIMRVDPNGMWIESLWDAASLAMGVTSLIDNIKQGNVGAAIVDGLGVIADGAALVLPIVPGGAGVAIKVIRAGDKAVDAVKTAKTVDKVTDATKTTKITENAAKGKAFEKEVEGTLKGDKATQMTVETADGTRTRVDFGQNKDGKVTLTEAKSSQTAPLTPNQKKAHPQIEQSGGTVKGNKGERIDLPAETQIPPTTVKIIRPDDLNKLQ